jgi:chemotaxis methyl-accepting protein methylase
MEGSQSSRNPKRYDPNTTNRGGDRLLDNPETGKGKEIVESRLQKVMVRMNKLNIRTSPEKLQEFREVTKLIDEDFAEQQQNMTKQSKRFFADKQHFELLNTGIGVKL